MRSFQTQKHTFHFSIFIFPPTQPRRSVARAAVSAAAVVSVYKQFAD